MGQTRPFAAAPAQRITFRLRYVRGVEPRLRRCLRGHKKNVSDLFSRMNDLPVFNKKEIVVVQNLKILEMTNDDKKLADIVRVAVGYKGEYQIAQHCNTTGNLVQDNRTDIHHLQRCGALADWRKPASIVLE